MGIMGVRDKVKAGGITDIFESNEAENLNDALKGDSRASDWMTDFNEFLKNYGYRTEGISDINLA